MLTWQRVLSVIIVTALCLTLLLCLFFAFPSSRTVLRLRTSAAADTGREDRWKPEVRSSKRAKKRPLPSNNSSVAEIQRQRQKLLSEVCSKYYRHGVKTGPLASTSVLRHKPAIFCRVAKVAVTTLKRAIAIGLGAPRWMSNNDIQKKYFPLLRRFGQARQKRILQNYYSFMFVRHPFERVVSAWLNKLVAKDYSKQDAAPFEEAARLIKRRYRSPGSRKWQTRPTFKEFVKFLVDPRTKRPFDRHWIPFYELCRPCQVRHNFIGHFETLQQDAEYVFRKIGLKNSRLDHLNASKKKASSIVRKEMSTLSPDELKKLTNLYRMDFLLFGYSPTF